MRTSHVLSLRTFLTPVRQGQERTTFLQSSAYSSLVQAAEDGGLDLQPSGTGEVYHVELVAHDAKELRGHISFRLYGFLMIFIDAVSRFRRNLLRWAISFYLIEYTAYGLQFSLKCVY